jgi:3-dehydroquinate dehydratase
LISGDDAKIIYNRLLVADQLEYRLSQIDSISKVLEFELRNKSKRDSLFNSIKKTNKELIDLEINLRKKIHQRDLKIDFLTNNYNIEKSAHDKTKTNLLKKKEEVVNLNLKMAKIKKRNTTIVLTLSGVCVSLVGAIVLIGVLN